VDEVELKPGGIELSINLPLSVDGTQCCCDAIDDAVH
jgi:hypothetical protein